jgi:hypothetical protein
MLRGTIPFEPRAPQYCDGRHHSFVTRRYFWRPCGREFWKAATFAQQEKWKDLENTIGCSRCGGPLVPTLSWDFQPLRVDQYAAPEASTNEFLEMLSVRKPSKRTAALVLLSARYFGLSPTAYVLDKLLLYWHDNCGRLPSSHSLCLLEHS